MRVLLAGCLACLVSFGAAAQGTGVPKEIVGYRNIEVTFSKSAAECNLTDGKMFEDRLRRKLADLGISQREDMYSMVGLNINARPFGLLDAQCVTRVEVVFQTLLGKDNIVTSDQRVRQLVDRLGVVPITYYKDGAFAVQAQTQPAAGGESTKAQEAALEMIDTIVERLKEKRQ